MRVRNAPLQAALWLLLCLFALCLPACKRTPGGDLPQAGGEAIKTQREAVKGFAVVRSEPGLLCADCGLGTPLAAAHIWACPACQHEERRPVSQLASAGHCEQCNP